MTTSSRLARDRAQDLDLLLIGDPERPREACSAGSSSLGLVDERGVAAPQRALVDDAGLSVLSMPRKTFSSTERCGTSVGSWAMIVTPSRSASRGEW